MQTTKFAIVALACFGATVVACAADDSGPKTTSGSGGAATSTGVSATSSATGSTGATTAGAGGGAATGATSTGTGGSTGGAAGSSTGTGGSSTGTGGSGMDAGKPNDVPASDSVDDIGAYIKNQQYRQAPWISDVDGPRAGKSGTQHGDGVRVWMNKTLADALRANHTGLNGAPYPDPGSMAVKELYDAMGQQVGAVAAYRTTDVPTGAAWVYYCYGPTMRCLADKDGTQAAPIYGRGNVAPTTACAICHGNTIYTRPPGVDGGL